MNRLQHLASDYVCPTDHKHGSNHTCYNSHKCRCRPCRDHTNLAADRRRRLRAYGRWEDFLVPATGTRRRLRALMAIGWTQSKLADRLGQRQSSIWQLMFDRGPTVQHPTYERISALYEQLWNTKPPRNSAADRSAYTRTVRYAAAQGWLPPLAWDDIDTDPEPPAIEHELFVDEILVQQVCNGGSGKLNTLERIEAIRILNSRDLSDAAIAEVIRMNQRSVFRIRSEQGIAAALGADGMPVAS